MKKYLDFKKEKEVIELPSTLTTQVDRPNKNLPPITPTQYPKEIHANNVHASDISETDTDGDSDDSNVRSVMKVLKEMYSERHIFMTNKDTTTAFGTQSPSRLIFDTGADTCVVGKGWRITHYYGPTIRLVGFDSKHARKRDLRICTAETILEHPSGNKYLVRIHQAVHNPSSKDSLLSEYQLSEAGCQIDSKPVNHCFPDGTMGTQSFKLPGVEDVFKLDIDSCLVTLPHREPTLEESETLDPINITNLNNWEPSEYNNKQAIIQKTIVCCHAIMLENDPESNIFYDCNTGDEDESFQDSIQDFNQDTWSVCPDALGDEFIKSVSQVQKQLSAYKYNPYNIADYARLAMNVQKEIKPKQMRKHHINPKEIQACLAYLPIETVKQTLKCTTQLAKWHVKLPLQKHWKPRFPFLNVHRLREPVATDTFFANCQAIGGHTCAQVFYGIQSHMINVYPIQTESEGPHMYEDFIRDEGCPTLLRRDNSKMQKGEDSLQSTDILL